MDAICLMKRKRTHWFTEKIRSPCLFVLFTPLLEKREYAEAVSFFLSNQW